MLKQKVSRARESWGGLGIIALNDDDFNVFAS